MSLLINSDFNGVTDPDAGRYIAAVEAADGQLLEFAVGRAMNNFIVGCKADGTWDAIKASCILAGARTLAGALVPLAGTAPTNFNFVSGDYNRKTGLVGDASTKYLNSNRNNNADPQNSKHLAVWRSSSATNNSYLIASSNAAGDSYIYTGFGLFIGSANDVGSSIASLSVAPASTFVGVSRSNSASFASRIAGINYSITLASQTPTATNIKIFGPDLTNARLAFYSIGESLDLALLDTRVTTMINAFAAAIP
jgi:hypothetical protein